MQEAKKLFPYKLHRLPTAYQLLGKDEWTIAERAEEADEPPNGPPARPGWRAGGTLKPFPGATLESSGQGAACKAQWAGGSGRQRAGTPAVSKLLGKCGPHQHLQTTLPTMSPKAGRWVNAVFTSTSPQLKPKIPQRLGVVGKCGLHQHLPTTLPSISPKAGSCR